MNPRLNRAIEAGMRITRLGLLPVRVRGGIAQGANWSLFPCTAYWRGTHEVAAQELVRDLLDWTGKSAWDLGSHFGLFAVGLGRRVGPGGSIAAFEPNPDSFRRLRLHVRRNGLDWVRLFRAAVSDRTGQGTLILGRDSSPTGSHLAYDDEAGPGAYPAVRVDSVQLDSLVDTGRIRPPDFIKVDIEGHGHRALAGASRTLAAHRPFILMGFHSPFEIAGAEKILLPLGYRSEPVRAGASAGLAIGEDYLFRPPAANSSRSDKSTSRS